MSKMDMQVRNLPKQNTDKQWHDRHHEHTIFCLHAMYVLCAWLAHVYDAACICRFLLRVLADVAMYTHALATYILPAFSGG